MPHTNEATTKALKYLLKEPPMTERTLPQRKFMRLFREESGYDFIDTPNAPFREQMQWNINWLRRNTDDMCIRLERAFNEMEPV